MDDLTSLGQEGLVARVNALRFAAVDFHKEIPGAEESVRRISRSLQMPECSNRYPEVSAIASILEKVDGSGMEANLQKFLPILRGITANIVHRQINVLCVEDDAVARQIIELRLSASNLSIYMASKLTDAEQILKEHDISLVLLDLGLPDGDGRDLLLRLRENPATTAIPVIVLSSKQGHQAQMECLALGANNFIPKPIDPVTISMLVTTELERSSEIMRRSLLDKLTGIPNRTAFCSALLRASQLAFRSGQPLSVALFDIDHFKTVNDLYGHAMGDEVLCRVASVVSRSLRDSDMLARWGGEEFAVFFPDTTPANAHIVLEKALTAFRTKQFVTKEGAIFQVSFSAGVALVNPSLPIDQSMAEADAYLYKAKAAGRGQVLGEGDKEAAFKTTILVVEDDNFITSMLQYCLEQHDFKVLYAKDAKHALEVASKNQISLITLDVNLPGEISGLELLQSFRKIKSLYHVPIVMLTSDDKQEDILRSFQLGADDYIKKPFLSRELVARIDRFLKKQ